MAKREFSQDPRIRKWWEEQAKRDKSERMALWWLWHGNQLVKHLKDGEGDVVTVLETIWLHDGGLTKEDEAYVITDKFAETIVSEAHASWVYYQLASRVSAANIRTGRPLPESLRLFAAAKLLGNFDQPKQRGPRRHVNWVRNLLLVRAIWAASALYFIPPTRNEATSEDVPCGCDLARAAMRRAGLTSLGYDRLQDIWADREEYLKIDEVLRLQAFIEAVADGP